MRTIHILGILVLLALAMPAAPAHAGGVVSVCDEPHLLAALAGGGTVTFACSGTITLTAEIAIAVDTTIDGSGQAVTISGNNAVRVFSVNSGATLNLNMLTIANGSRTFGGGIRNDGGTLTVSNSTFFGNSANNSGGGIYSYNGAMVTVSNSIFSGNTTTGAGGGILNSDGTLTVSNSTFSANSANYGGGIYNWGTLIVSNSTFSSNFAGGYLSGGGGISNNTGTVTVSNSTFAANRADRGAIFNSDYNGTVRLTNTIIANNQPGGNCYGGITDGGGNLSYPDTTCPGINADPMLGTLQNNGGPTETLQLGPGSAALDAGIDAICAADPVNNLDQRAVVRPLGRHCDIGAVEQQPYRTLWFPSARVH